MSKHLLLVDADIAIFKAAAAVEQSYLWVDGWNEAWRSNWARIEDAKSKLEETLSILFQSYPRTKYHRVMCITDSRKPCFRTKVYEKYKHNRKAKVKPVVFGELRRYVFSDDFPEDAVWLPQLEADDVIGLYSDGQTPLGNHKKPYKSTTVISMDKDLLTIPGITLDRGWLREYDSLQWESKVSVTDQTSADDHFFFQTLTGDATDCYPGCKNVGEKKAKAIIEKAREEGEDVWEHVLSAFKKSHGEDGEAMALQQARCARILRPGEYDFEKGEPILWTP